MPMPSKWYVLFYLAVWLSCWGITAVCMINGVWTAGMIMIIVGFLVFLRLVLRLCQVPAGSIEPPVWMKKLVEK